MSKGKAKCNYLDMQGHAAYQTVPSWGFIYEASTIKNPNYNIGDRVVLPDGRVFRYAKSGSAINVDRACEFYEDEAQGWTVLDAGTNTAIGSTSVTVNGGTHAALTKDELRGGYIIIFKDGGGGYTQFRGIIGNAASAEDADIVVYLDAPLDVAVVGGTTACEVFYNPYADLREGSYCNFSKAGKAAVHVTAANMYFWVQTWGPCWIAPNTSDAAFTTYLHGAAFFRHDGGIEGEIATGSRTTENPTQRAGFLINEGYSAGPLLMLQISP